MDLLPIHAPERKILRLHNCLCVYSSYPQSAGAQFVDAANITKSSSRAAPCAVTEHPSTTSSGCLQSYRHQTHFSLNVSENIPVLQVEGNPESWGLKQGRDWRSPASLLREQISLICSFGLQMYQQQMLGLAVRSRFS